MEGVLKVLDYAATHACMRMGKDGKREDCVCATCEARRLRFGENIPVQVQEPMRADLEAARLAACTAIITEHQRDEAWVREAKLQSDLEAALKHQNEFQIEIPVIAEILKGLGQRMAAGETLPRWVTIFRKPQEEKPHGEDVNDAGHQG